MGFGACPRVNQLIGSQPRPVVGENQRPLKSKSKRRSNIAQFDPALTSGNDALDDVPVDVSKSIITTPLAKGQFLVINTSEVQYGGVEVVKVGNLVDGLHSKFIFIFNERASNSPTLYLYS